MNSLFQRRFRCCRRPLILRTLIGTLAATAVIPSLIKGIQVFQFNFHHDYSNSLNFSNALGTLHELNSYEPSPSPGRGKKFSFRLITSSIALEIRHFHVVVMQ